MEVAGEIAQRSDAELDCVMNNQGTQERQFTSPARLGEARRLDSMRPADAFRNLVDCEMTAGRDLHREPDKELIGAQGARVPLITHHDLAIHGDANARQNESLIGGVRCNHLSREHREGEVRSVRMTVPGRSFVGLVGESGIVEVPFGALEQGALGCGCGCTCEQLRRARRCGMKNWKAWLTISWPNQAQIP